MTQDELESFCLKKKEALVLPIPHGGVLIIRKDIIETVQADSREGRNTRCYVNGIDTDAGLDFVLKQLDWKLTNEYGEEVKN